MLCLIAILACQLPPGGEWKVHHTTYATQYEGHGQSMDWIGDVDGDGFSDYILGSNLYQATGSNRGVAYIYSGQSGLLLDRIDGDSVPYPFTLATAVSRLGDVTGDGRPEVAISKQAAGGSGQLFSVMVYSVMPFTLVYEAFAPHLLSTVGSDGICGDADLNGDGWPDIAAGDSSYKESGIWVGAVHAFDGLDGSPLWIAKGVTLAQSFGQTIACPGDVDGDGHADVVTRSYEYGAFGTIHVLSGVDGSELYSFHGDYLLAYAGLGRLAPCGDADGDGLPDYMVGQDEVTGLSKGIATIHRGYDGAIIHRWEGQAAGQRFGDKVAGPGDLDGDGFADYAVGAPGADTSDPGRVYLFSGRDFSLMQVLTSPSPDEGSFGYPVANLGADVNGDGAVELLTADGSEPYNGVFGSGVSYMFTFDKHLTADAREISAAAGGTVRFALDFPASEAGLGYRLLASEDATGSIKVGGVGIPLTLTPLLQRFVFTPPTVIDAPVGTLDAQGDAAVTATLPPDVLASFVGRTLKFAAVSMLTPAQPSRSSAAIWMTVRP